MNFRTEPLWDDDVGSGCWSSLRAVRDWSDIGEDMLRIYPRLLPRSGLIPKPVADRIAECVAVLAWRLCGSDSASSPLRAISPYAVQEVGRAKTAAWFPLQTRGWLGFPKRSEFWTSRDEDLNALNLLDALLCSIKTESVGPFSEATAAEFAFRTGIHPAYIWPEALLSNQLFTAVGWLGYVARGRGARMSHDMAEYLLDVLHADHFGVVWVHDANLDYYLNGDGIKGRLLYCARRRLRGRSTIFHANPANEIAYRRGVDPPSAPAGQSRSP
ncbi:hypothetical protein [Beijerinckia sp. L45]|uniref:hypothetical protein n=1 Tax=Beijerinckia sp. L45 TaxID=1641855 RepID=UPI00131C18CA|nr:hypothetical protein [Beijerinckia sp. L45]